MKKIECCNNKLCHHFLQGGILSSHIVNFVNKKNCICFELIEKSLETSRILLFKSILKCNLSHINLTLTGKNQFKDGFEQ